MLFLCSLQALKALPFEKGELLLTTDPEKGFTVKIDGKKVGTTPLKPISLWEGTHEVELTSKSDKKRRTYSLTVLPGKNPRTIRVRR